VLQRIIRTKLSVYQKDGEILCQNKVFSATAGLSTVKDIVDALEGGKSVIIDTSKIGDEAELLIGSIIANEILAKYQNYKAAGQLDDKLPVSIVIEEAPRVLGADKLEAGDNIYSRIAREGRKFKIGLVAITQLTSIIPRDILTNMNTKIILGNEMVTERHAIINSAAQDLSDDDRTIASLDKGEAIVSSIFTKFAVPIQIPLFEEMIGEQAPKKEHLEYKG
jgi:DNA helicase HerA-like ATPase